MANSELFEILLLAMVAGVILFRLYTVLGRRTGHEPPPQQEPYRVSAPSDAPANVDNVVALPGRARFDDGSFVRVAYDGQNGQPYTPIGRTLIADGSLPRDGMSMQVLRSWLKSHPGDVRRVMETDQSFVFFREQPVGDPSLGAEGSEGV